MKIREGKVSKGGLNQRPSTPPPPPPKGHGSQRTLAGNEEEMKRQKILSSSHNVDYLNHEIERHNEMGWHLVIGSVQCHDRVDNSVFKSEVNHTPQWTCVVERGE